MFYILAHSDYPQSFPLAGWPGFWGWGSFSPWRTWLRVSSRCFSILLCWALAIQKTLGMLLSVGGVGFLLGSLTMSAWGGPRPRIWGVLGFSTLQGSMLFVAGLPPRVEVIAVATFIFFFSVPIINGCSQVIWQSKTPPDLQGRVFAMRRMVSWASLPLAYLAAGPLADHLFEPLLAKDGALAKSVGKFLGTGPGRGIAFFLHSSGGCLWLVALAGGLCRPLRRVEVELPDAVE